MDETFINKAFLLVSQPVSVKVIRRKDNGLPAGYCFIEFPSEAEAERVLKLVNGTNITGSNPTKRFRLNRSQAGKMWDIGPSFSIFVGDLDASVTDDKLEDFFLKRYRSVKGAKIMYEEGGVSRGYGFVRFSDESEQKRALVEMQGAKGLGAKSIRVSVATPKENFRATPLYQIALLLALLLSQLHTANN
uniref:tRNA selenocysteine-associated protein 1 n=1 Tax=Ciona savignyi TaxID=51511 RepID=H2ZR52_CIOSA